ncbi:hypothetical protein C8J57DRAFT_1300090 [Mycena rebaudengoi]|nr:hypothetical protein C8J57DRAFT_1300090 [Mycena rebaudengoi]
MSHLDSFVAEHLSPEPTLAALTLRLAHGSVRLFKEMATGQKPLYHRTILFEWGYFVRASTHSLKLLQDIREFPSFETFSDLDIYGNEPENYHSILQWLKTFPNPPFDLINIWEDYLMDSWKQYPSTRQDDNSLEARWREWQTDISGWFPHHNHHPMFQQGH